MQTGGAADPVRCRVGFFGRWIPKGTPMRELASLTIALVMMAIIYPAVWLYGMVKPKPRPDWQRKW